MDCSLPGSSVHEISFARVGCQFLLQDVPDPGIERTCPALASGFFTTKPPGEPIYMICIAYHIRCIDM